MTIEEIRKEWDKTNNPPKDLNSGFAIQMWIDDARKYRAILASKFFEPLLAVAEAASAEEIFWNEERCNRKECHLLDQARDRLQIALDTLVNIPEKTLDK